MAAMRGLALGLGDRESGGDVTIERAFGCRCLPLGDPAGGNPAPIFRRFNRAPEARLHPLRLGKIDEKRYS